MSVKQKYRTLIDKISERTDNGLLNWQLVGDSSTVQTRIGSYSVQLAAKTRDNDVPLIFVYLINDEGDVIESFHDENIDEEFSNDYYALMKDILSRARRSASGADEALDSILRELG